MNKPDCPIIGADGNIFNLVAIAKVTLRRNGMHAEAKEMQSRVLNASNYHDALSIIMEYVNPVEVDE